MSLKRPAKDQPKNFEFNSSSLEAARVMVAKYPEGKQQSAVMALLYIAQKQNNNWIPLAAMKYIAKFLDMPYIKVYEVATFYTMYNNLDSTIYDTIDLYQFTVSNISFAKGWSIFLSMFTSVQSVCSPKCTNITSSKINKIQIHNAWFYAIPTTIVTGLESTGLSGRRVKSTTELDAGSLVRSTMSASAEQKYDVKWRMNDGSLCERGQLSR